MGDPRHGHRRQVDAYFIQVQSRQRARAATTSHCRCKRHSAAPVTYSRATLHGHVRNVVAINSRSSIWYEFPLRPSRSQLSSQFFYIGRRRFDRVVARSFPAYATGSKSRWVFKHGPASGLQHHHGAIGFAARYRAPRGAVGHASAQRFQLQISWASTQPLPVQPLNSAVEHGVGGRYPSDYTCPTATPTYAGSRSTTISSTAP